MKEKIKVFFAIGQEWHKKWWIYPILLIILCMPFVINECYKLGGYITLWEAKDVLSFYGSFLSFLGTLVLGALALSQNNKFKVENDESQNRLERLTIQANKISEQLMSLEKDKFRPYIKISDNDIFFAVSESDCEHIEKINDFIKRCAVHINGCNPFDEEDIERCTNSFYSQSLAITFNIQNIGQSAIANFHLDRLVILDGITGPVKGFKRSIDTSLMPNSEKSIAITVTTQVPYFEEDNESKIKNKIYNHYLKQVKSNISLLVVEITIGYEDIFGRKYEQEYSLHMQYDLDKKLEDSMIMKVKKQSVEHHTGKSPYGPREV